MDDDESESKKMWLMNSSALCFVPDEGDAEEFNNWRYKTPIVDTRERPGYKGL